MDLSSSIPGCSNFTWKEALWLPSWQVAHAPSQEELDNLTKTFQTLQKIRDYLGSGINIHCAIRPILNAPGHPKDKQDYNHFVNGADHSAHKLGLAVDFDVSGMTCGEAIAKLMCKLVEFNIRVENNGPFPTWVHVDLTPPHPNRYFVP